MSDGVRRGCLENVVEHVLRQPRRLIFEHVSAVVGVSTGLAAFYRHTPTIIRTGQVGTEIQIEVFAEWRALRGLGRGAGTNCQDFVKARPFKRKLGLEYLGVRVSLHTLADG